jgi:hypothetical protein
MRGRGIQACGYMDAHTCTHAHVHMYVDANEHILICHAQGQGKFRTAQLCEGEERGREVERGREREMGGDGGT